MTAASWAIVVGGCLLLCVAAAAFTLGLSRYLVHRVERADRAEPYPAGSPVVGPPLSPPSLTEAASRIAQLRRDVYAIAEQLLVMHRRLTRIALATALLVTVLIVQAR